MPAKLNAELEIYVSTAKRPHVKYMRSTGKIMGIFVMIGALFLPENISKKKNY